MSRPASAPRPASSRSPSSPHSPPAPRPGPPAQRRRRTRRPRHRRHAHLPRAPDLHEPLPAAGRLLPERRARQQHHRPPDVAEPRDARDRAVDRHGLDGERRRHRVHLRPPRRRHLLGRHGAGRRRGREELRHLRPRQRGPRAHRLGGDQQLRLQRGRRRRHRDLPLLRAGARLPAGDVDDQLRSALARTRSTCRSRSSARATRPTSSAPARSSSPTRSSAPSSRLAARDDYDWAPPRFEHQGARLPRRDPPDRHARGQRAHRLAAVGPGRLHPLRAGLRRGARRVGRLRRSTPRRPAASTTR